MKNHTLNKLFGIIGSSIIAIAAGLVTETPKAQAAVLTYNFTANTTGWTAGTYTGYFKFDNSSLTGIGEEIVAISEGVFNFVDAENKPDSYNLKSAKSTVNGGDSFISTTGGLEFVEIAAYVLDGDFMGLSFGRQINSAFYTTSLINGVPRFIDEGLRQFMGADILYLTIDPYTDVLDGYLRVQLNRLGSEDRPYQGTVTYTGPERAVDVPCATVPEPMTVAGTALALAGCAALKCKKNKQQLS